MKVRFPKGSSSDLVASFSLGVGGGAASYEENVSIALIPVQSEWEAGMFSLHGSASLIASDQVLLELNGELWSTPDEEESWREDGRLVQRNDMNLQAVHLLGQVGYGFLPEPEFRLAPHVGLDFHAQRFERSDFEFFPDRGEPSPGTVTETFGILNLRLALSVELPLSDALSLQAEGGMGLVLDYLADNSALGEIEGGDGTILDVELILSWTLSEQQSIKTGFVYEIQDMQGNVIPVEFVDDFGRSGEGALELPDNELQRFLAVVRWAITL